MIKVFSIIISFTLLLILSGCSKEHSESSALSDDTQNVSDGWITTITPDAPDFSAENFPSYEEVAKQYPDKTVLVWLLDDLDGNTRTRTRETNEYLSKNGCDFVICFDKTERGDVTAGNFPDSRIAGIEKALSSGKQIDIVYSRIYPEFVSHGLFEPLDDYLENTEKGRTLYELMPEKYWEGLRLNGSVYGVCGSLNTMLDSDSGYLVNAELAQKYDFDISKPILEQLDILKKVKENESNCPVFVSDMIFDPMYYVNLKAIGEAAYWDGNTHSAKCVLDNPEYIERLRFFCILNQEGLLSEKNDTAQTFFISDIHRQGAALGYADTQTIEYSFNGRTVTAIPVFNGTSTLRSHPYMVTGVCSSSQNKEKAFELLTLTQTDPYLCNLLSFGIEGVDYNLVGDIVDRVETPGNPSRFGNVLICHQYDRAFYSAERYREIFENLSLHKDHDFSFDDSTVTKEMNATMNVMEKFKLPQSEQELDSMIAELRNKLEAAGLQKIIDECNRQYEVYINEKN